MHSLRCLRMMQMRTFIFVGVICVSITFLVLFYYNNSQPQEVEPSQLQLGHEFLMKLKHQHQILNKLKTSQVISENATFYFMKDNRPPLSVPRLAKYCNHAQNHMDGQEGLVPANYKLLAVHTVIRHGDRSPIYKLPNGLSSDLSCLVNTDQYSHVSKIVNYPQIMTAEMGKTPAQKTSFFRWSLFPSHETCGEGQLTGQGAIQHILNGMHMSERYFHKHKLFAIEDWQNNVLIHSTEVSRTYQSAIAFSYGMLPNFDIHKLLVTPTLNLNFCEEREFGHACQCKKGEEFRLKAEAECKTNVQVKKSNQEYKKLLAYVSKVLNLSPFSIPGPTSLMDGLSEYTCHSKPYPCNANGTCITSRVMDSLWKVIDTKSECLGQSKSYTTYGRTLMHGLLFRIARNFNISIHNGSNARFHLYSGHDTTISPLVVALGLTDNVWPGYAHRIVFELWKDTVSKSDNYFRVLQNGQDVTAQVAFCKDKTSQHGMCNFNHFLNYIQERNLRSFCFSTKKSDSQFF